MREPLFTERLVLRDVTDADAELLFELDSDREVMRFIGPRPADDVGPYRERIRSVYMPWKKHPWHGVRLVFDHATTQFLGWAFIRPATESVSAAELGWTSPTEVEVGYRFHQAAWGRGIATEAAAELVELALDDLSTTAVVACALVGNKGSLRVLEKLGFKRVGEVQQSSNDQPTVKLIRECRRD